MKNFFRSVFQGVRNIGLKINRGYNAVKSFVRRHSSKIKETAGMIKETLKYVHDLPYIGDAAKVIGGVAGGVEKGVDLANRGINYLENWQRYAGYPIQNDQPVNPLLGQQPVLVR